MIYYNENDEEDDNSSENSDDPTSLVSGGGTRGLIGKQPLSTRDEEILLSKGIEITSYFCGRLLWKRLAWNL